MQFSLISLFWAESFVFNLLRYIILTSLVLDKSIAGKYMTILLSTLISLWKLNITLKLTEGSLVKVSQYGDFQIISICLCTQIYFIMSWGGNERDKGTSTYFLALAYGSTKYWTCSLEGLRHFSGPLTNWKISLDLSSWPFLNLMVSLVQWVNALLMQDCVTSRNI